MGSMPAPTTTCPPQNPNTAPVPQKRGVEVPQSVTQRRDISSVSSQRASQSLESTRFGSRRFDFARNGNAILTYIQLLSRNVVQYDLQVGRATAELWPVTPDWVELLLKCDPGYWCLHRSGQILLLALLVEEELYGRLGSHGRPGIKLPMALWQESATYKHFYDSWYRNIFLRDNSDKMQLVRSCFCFAYGMTDASGVYRFDYVLGKFLDDFLTDFKRNRNTNRAWAQIRMVKNSSHVAKSQWTGVSRDMLYDSARLFRDFLPGERVPEDATVRPCDIEGTVGQEPIWRGTTLAEMHSRAPIPAQRVNQDRPWFDADMVPERATRNSLEDQFADDFLRDHAGLQG